MPSGRSKTGDRRKKTAGKRGKMTVHTSANSKATIHETHGITETLMNNLIKSHENQISSLHVSYKAQLAFLKDTIKEKNQRIVKLELEVSKKVK